MGVGGGAPNTEHDIRLGDVLVGEPDQIRRSRGLVQYDFGKMMKDSIFQITGSLKRPPDVSTLKSNHMLEGPKMSTYVSEALQSRPRLQSTSGYQGQEYDRLYKPSYEHGGIANTTCARCDESFLVN